MKTFVDILYHLTLVVPIVIPEIKGNEKWDSSIPGPGWFRTRRYDNGGWARPLVKCKCGKVGGISLHHVHADGRVTASYYDSQAAEFEHNGKKYSHTPGCGWHVYIKLDGYDCGEFLPDTK